MRLQRIRYENFRNHPLLSFEPSEGINLLYGPNGSGKTSMLEGIHFCALTKGFVSATDSDCLAFSKDYFVLDSSFYDESDSVVTVKVTYTKEREKQIIVNNSEIKPFSRHIGRVPCITFSPQEMVIVNGAPVERRRFIDAAISQIDRRYLDDLLSYRRVLNQRNALLSQLNAMHQVHSDMLLLWTENLSRLAASIVHTRLQFAEDFFDQFKKIYRQLSIIEDPSISYRCSAGKISQESSIEFLYSLFLAKFEETEKYEIMRAQTMTGPHRDDLVFSLNEKEIKKYASQGQMRTFLICLKLAQHRFFFETLGEKPICLLDDMFSELDASRTTDILSILETCGQSIITSAELRKQSNMTIHSINSLKKTGE